MGSRIYKISNEQYERLNEEGVFDNTSSKQPEKVIQAKREDASSALQQANSDKTVTKIEFTNEDVISKSQLVSEARREWKNGTKVVKLSELLKR